MKRASPHTRTPEHPFRRRRPRVRRRHSRVDVSLGGRARNIRHGSGYSGAVHQQDTHRPQAGQDEARWWSRASKSPMQAATRRARRACARGGVSNRARRWTESGSCSRGAPRHSCPHYRHRYPTDLDVASERSPALTSRIHSAAAGQTSATFDASSGSVPDG